VDAPRPEISLTTDELRAIATYGAGRATTVLRHFTDARPDDARVLDGGRVGELVRALDEAVRGSVPPDRPGQARW
jgi:hypothetical protein